MLVEGDQRTDKLPMKAILDSDTHAKVDPLQELAGLGRLI